jgi:hypothetical protein
VARNDDRPRVAAERLADRACRRGRADLRRELAVCEHLPRTDRARRGIDPAVEVVGVREVERRAVEIDVLACEQASDRIDDARDRAGRLRLDRIWSPASHAPAQRFARRFGQPDGAQAGVVPGDRAVADRGREDGIAACARHRFLRAVDPRANARGRASVRSRS